MRRRPAFLAALAVLCTVAIAHLPGNAGEGPPAEELTVIVYPVSDLPVWKYASAIKTTTGADDIVRWTQDRPDGETEFDPSLLISVIKSSVDPESWDESGSISPLEKSAALVVRATDPNHKQICDLLEEMRTADQRKHARAKESAKKLMLSKPKIVLPRSPLLEQLEAMPYEQRVHVPIDVEVLADRLARPTVPHEWPSYKEWDVPVDRDYYLGGYRLTR